MMGGKSLGDRKAIAGIDRQTPEDGQEGPQRLPRPAEKPLGGPVAAQADMRRWS